MAKTKNCLKQIENDGKRVTPEPNDYSNTHSKSLGNGRWKYQGKTYKEEPLGKV